MPVKLTNEVLPNVPVGLMKDGDIAIITECEGVPQNVGKIITRYDSTLIALGQPVGKSWINHFPTRSSAMRVRILQPGEQLTIV